MWQCDMIIAVSCDTISVMSLIYFQFGIYFSLNLVHIFVIDLISSSQFLLK